MCGIVGYFNIDSYPISKPPKDWLIGELKYLVRRGPDSQRADIYSNGDVGLGHTRLAILDLSSAGEQPMTSFDGSLTLAYNGELYNSWILRSELESSHGLVFRGHSDSEVVLNALRVFGWHSLKRFDGMFALAAYDRSSRTVVLARDAAGEKPLYYCIEDRVVAFSSDLRSLLRFSKNAKLSKQGVAIFARRGWTTGSQTIFENIFRVLPGRAIKFSLASSLEPQEMSFGELPTPIDIHSRTQLDSAKVPLNTLTRRLGDLIEQSVSERLATDRACGFALSGGVDSSLVAYYASRASSFQIDTFCLVQPLSMAHNEASYAAMVSKRIGSRHNEIPISNIGPQDIEDIFDCVDDPFVDSSLIPTFQFFKNVAKEKSVLIGGDGADELFGGYTYYSALLRWLKLISGIPKSFRVTMVRRLLNLTPRNFKGRGTLEKLGHDYERYFPDPRMLFNSLNTKSLFTLDLPDVDTHLMFNTNGDLRHTHIVDLYMRNDFNDYLSDCVLRKVDRASMYHSLEVRSPFLAKRLIEFAFQNIPFESKVTISSTKVLLKSLAKERIGSDINWDRKHGFSVPIDDILRQESFKDYFHYIGSEPKIINAKVFKNMVVKLNAGFPYGERIFAVCMLESFLRRNNFCT